MEIISARYGVTRPPKKHSRPFKQLILLVVIGLVASATIFSFRSITEAVPNINSEETSSVVKVAEQPIELAWPVRGQAAIGSSSEGLLAVSPSQQQMPIASMTKVITALAVIEKQPIGLGETGKSFTIGQNDILSYQYYISQGGSAMGVMPGQTITLRHALEGMMLPSANNIADSLVIWVFGSMDAYLSYANNLIQQWGLKDTIIADASGFSAASKSTPSDMIALGERLMDDPVLAEIVSMKESDIPVTGKILNTNALVQMDEAVGIKTGHTNEAGSCLLFASKHGPEDSELLIGVLMGQPSYSGMFSSAIKLRDSALGGFGNIEVLPAGAAVGRLTTVWGDSANIVTVQPLKTFGWLAKDHKAEISIDQVDQSVLQNQIIGQASIPDSDNSVQLMTDSAIDQPGLFWRLFN